ncbi:HAD family hydrolase [Sandarakinorhabdus sp.]|uniref:sulfotransferase-like domain-containing protein n=1 Tax=Sandarakinorhabdus sp. TaxID=1916663 RepID=UPI00286E6781|nr:HAD family hydrolase [Sandarakinorhabdus sp.]
MTLRIAMWSGPRNLSTAMMRSFGARADCHVSDEPFYGAYLHQTGDDHPMADAVIADMDCDWHSVAATLSGPCAQPVWYQKHMVHHMIGPVQLADLSGFKHAFLIRAPERVIASYAAKREVVTAQGLGFAQQRAWFEAEADRLGHAPPVVDSADVLADPAGTLSRLCAVLGIAWTDAMLHWAPGARDTDGVWAPHWYGRVLDSTGFDGREGPLPELTGEATRVRDACRPHYEFLSAHKL